MSRTRQMYVAPSVRHYVPFYQYLSSCFSMLLGGFFFSSPPRVLLFCSFVPSFVVSFARSDAILLHHLLLIILTSPRNAEFSVEPPEPRHVHTHWPPTADCCLHPSAIPTLSVRCTLYFWGTHFAFVHLTTAFGGSSPPATIRLLRVTPPPPRQVRSEATSPGSHLFGKGERGLHRQWDPVQSLPSSRDAHGFPPGVVVREDRHAAAGARVARKGGG